MSNEEMQFADPEWQPPAQRGSTLENEAYNPQPINSPRDEQTGWQNPPHEESDGASSYDAGYRAQQHGSYTVPPRQRQRRRSGFLFWIILALIVLSILGGRPYFFEGIVLDNLFFGLIILGIIITVIAVLRSRRRR